MLAPTCPTTFTFECKSANLSFLPRTVSGLFHASFGRISGSPNAMSFRKWLWTLSLDLSSQPRVLFETCWSILIHEMLLKSLPINRNLFLTITTSLVRRAQEARSKQDVTRNPRRTRKFDELFILIVHWNFNCRELKAWIELEIREYLPRNLRCDLWWKHSG